MTTSTKPKSDQASRLRDLVSALRSPNAQSTPERAPEPRPLPTRRPTVPVIASTSGKGGVGKTCIATQIALGFAANGARPALLDADLGAANADVMLGVTPRRRLTSAMGELGAIDLAQLATEAPGGVSVVAGLTGGDPTDIWRRRVLSGLWTLDDRHDVIIIDTGGGLSEGVRAFIEPADTVAVVTSPEPTSIADAYGLIKLICARSAVDAGIERPDRIGLIVNMAMTPSEGSQVHARIARVAERFLGVDIPLWGVVPSDLEVVKAVRKRDAVTLSQSASPAAAAFQQLAHGLMRRVFDRRD